MEKFYKTQTLLLWNIIEKPTTTFRSFYFFRNNKVYNSVNF